MPRKEWYKQCKMVRPIEGKEDSFETMVSWIPAQAAKIGAVVHLKEFPSDKEWDKGWIVISAGDKKPGDKIEARATDYKHQRKVSDV